MSVRRMLCSVLWVSGCHEPDPANAPLDRAKPEPALTLSEADEALLASLSSDDPGDFYDDRARLWRIGQLQWQVGQPSLSPEDRKGESGPAGSLPQPLLVVVLDPVGPRVLLPLDQLEWRPPAPELVRVSAEDEQGNARSPEPLWTALRLAAVVSPGDLVAGLRRDLAPTPWLELDAGIPLTPFDREGERLRVGWDDPECGFGLTLTIDPSEFGPLHQPGPASPADPAPEPEPSDAASRASSLRLDPATPIYASAEQREPLLRLHPATKVDPDGPGWIGQVITRAGPPKRGRTPIVLRCHGVGVQGWVETAALRESPGRYAFVEQTEPPPVSTCAAMYEASLSTMPVPVGTVLHGPTREVVGIVAHEVEMLVRVDGGWMATCVPSPWGDLDLWFRAR